MIETLSRTHEINERLEKENKISYLDKPEHLAAIETMNDEMEQVRRDYQVKDRSSQMSAAQVILTA